jgi:site-specific DNA-methyltransferase (adenine-specific)
MSREEDRAPAGASVTCTLLHGDHRDVLDVVVDNTISDPPYGQRTHEGHNDGSLAAINGFEAELDYSHWTPDDVHEYVRHWSPRTRSWMVSMTSHDLISAWEAAMREAGRYCFAPLPYIDFGKGPRVLGDGPASWTCYIIVARPRSEAWLTDWRRDRKALDLPRSLPGAYKRELGDVTWTPPGGGKRIGGKPLGLMRALVRDYSLPGQMIADPYAGHGTTLRAAIELGRHAIGAEIDLEVWTAAIERLRQPVALDLFTPRSPRAAENGVKQVGLPGF